MQGPYPLDLLHGKDIKRVLQDIGCDEAGIKWMQPKGHVYPLLLRDVKCPAANILKQHMLSLGGDAAVARWSVNCSKETTNVLLLGNTKHYDALAEKILYQPWGLKGLSERLKQIIKVLRQKETIVWQWPHQSLKIGEKALVMGILNVTPDSFSDGGKYNNTDRAIIQATKMVADGADIIDIGGESTRPGSNPVSLEEELDRIMPVVEVLLKEVPIPISLDTYKAGVAEEALKLGCHIINDVGGGRLDITMPQVIAKYEAPVVIMHNPGAVEYSDLIYDCVDQLEAIVQTYETAGISPHNIVIDPGIGFGKKPTENLLIIKNLQSFEKLGKPILVGASRKSFIGAVLNLEVTERLEGSLAAAAWAVNKGADILRVHDVLETVRLVKMLEAIKGVGVNR